MSGTGINNTNITIWLQYAIQDQEAHTWSFGKGRELMVVIYVLCREFVANFPKPTATSTPMTIKWGHTNKRWNTYKYNKWQQPEHNHMIQQVTAY